MKLPFTFSHPRSWTRWAKAFAIVGVVVVVLDQWTKYLAIGALTRAFQPLPGSEPLSFGERLSAFLWTKHPSRGENVEVLADFWHFRYVENPGAAWGFLQGHDAWYRTPFFLLVAVAAMVFIISYYQKSTPQQWLVRAALSLVFGGAIGNFLDRVRLGYVIDFIDWHWYDKATWPTFNIADSAISVGVTLLILDMLLHRDGQKADDAETNKTNAGKKANA